MKFTKMHGLGNDFLIVENLDCSLKKVEELTIGLCNRKVGIGADGVLLVEASVNCDVKMRLINSDGTEAEMCGNGIRCFAKYVYEKGIVTKNPINIETAAGTMVAELEIYDNNVMSTKINMGKPTFEKQLIPFKGEEDNLNYKIVLDKREYQATTILMGVPHTVVYVNKIENEEILEYGRKIERLAYFPQRTNVNFVKIIDKNTIAVKTWERGAGLTLACGTGTCASVVATYLKGYTNNMVEAQLALGTLKINYDGTNVFMEGPAEYICEGETLL